MLKLFPKLQLVTKISNFPFTMITVVSCIDILSMIKVCSALVAAVINFVTMYKLFVCTHNLYVPFT